MFGKCTNLNPGNLKQQMAKEWAIKNSQANIYQQVITLSDFYSACENKYHMIKKSSIQLALEKKAVFIGSKLATTTFLSLDILTTVCSLEAHFQNLKSLRSLQPFQLLRQPSKSAIFLRDAQKNTFLMSLKYAKNRRGRKCIKRIHP